jgi:hypothetical protein
VGRARDHPMAIHRNSIGRRPTVGATVGATAGGEVGRLRQLEACRRRRHRRHTTLTHDAARPAIGPPRPFGIGPPLSVRPFGIGPPLSVRPFGMSAATGATGATAGVAARAATGVAGTTGGSLMHPGRAVGSVVKAHLAQPSAVRS